MGAVEEISVRDLKARLDAHDALKIIDVREQWEFEYAQLGDAELKPLGGIGAWARELDPAGEYVLICHSGIRSRQACMLLKQMGIANVKNLKGGIDAWSVYIDPSVPRY